MTDPQGVVIADDITGANDTGSRLARRGYQTKVVLDPLQTVSSEVLVVDTESRELASEDAYKIVRSVVDRYEGTVFYKKIDSTLRGNVANELAALLDGASPDLLLLAPAFPTNNRTTENGVQLVDEEPVLDALTDSENLPLTSDIPSLLSSLEYDVETVDLETVESGTVAIRSRLAAVLTERDRPVVVVADALSTDDLRSLAAAASAIEATVAYAGSGGLAGSLTLGTPHSVDRSVLGVVGSISETSFSQLAALPTDAVVSLDPMTVVESPKSAAGAAVDQLVDAQRSHGYAVVASATSPADVETATSAGDRLELDEATVKRRVRRALQETVQSVHEANPVTGLFTTGGATTVSVLDAFAADFLELTGTEIADGIPLVRIRGGALDGTPLVTKAGSFGEPTTIVNCLDFLGSR